MHRFLSSAMAGCVLLTTSSLSWALGIGQVSAYSAPGQPVRVDIELTDTAGVQARDVLMRVADEVDHEAKGLVRPEWADGSYIEVRESPAGGLVGRLVSPRRSTGSQLDFVVQLRQGASLQVQTISATAGSGSPLLSQPAAPARPAPAPAPAPAPQPAAAPQPIVESRPAPAPAPMVAPAPVPAVPADLADDMGMPSDTGFDAGLDSDMNGGLDDGLDADSDGGFDDVLPDADSDGFDAGADVGFDTVRSTDGSLDEEDGSRLKPHEYFNRVLVLFFILCFAVWGLIRKLIHKLR